MSDVDVDFDDEFTIDPGLAAAFRRDGHACVRGLATAAEVAAVLPCRLDGAPWRRPTPTDRIRPVMTVIYFADGARVVAPTDDFQRFDLALSLKGLQPGDVAASDRNPLLYP